VSSPDLCRHQVVRSRKIAAANFNDYVTLDPGEALTVTGVRNRLVVTFGHTGQDLKAILPYVVLLARPVRGGNVTTHGVARHKRAAVAIGAVAARGRLLFRQVSDVMSWWLAIVSDVDDGRLVTSVNLVRALVLRKVDTSYAL